jgi:hypothetical protein
MQGWLDVAYFRQWVEAVRASEVEAAKSPGLVTRVTRKPHDFRPPVVSVHSVGPEDYIENVVAPEPTSEDDDPNWEALKLQRKHQKKQARLSSARARIPTWYDLINDEDP